MTEEQHPQQDGGELSQGEIDALLNQGSEASGAGGGETGAPAGELPVEVTGLLGDAAPPLTALARRAAEVFVVGLESATGGRLALESADTTLTSYVAVEAEFSDIAHMGFEVRVQLSPSEAHLAAVLAPLDDLAALLSLDLSVEQLMDEEFAAGQTELVAQSIREVLDLVSLTLFSDDLGGVEATLADQRVGQPEFTMGMLSDVSQEAPPLRLDVALSLPGGAPARLVLVIPSTLLFRLAAMLGVDVADGDPGDAGTASAGAATGDGEPSVNEPTPLYPGGAQGGFGLGDELPGTGRPVAAAGTTPGSGAGEAGDGVDVHPVRFPPLTAYPVGSAGAQSLDLIMDVSMRVTVELGRSSMTVEEVLSLGPGSVVELNRLAGEPLDVMVNDQLIARGEVVVVDENFGVRVTEIVSPRRRVHAMGAS